MAQKAKDNRNSGPEPTGKTTEWDRKCKYCGSKMMMENPKEHDIEVYECSNAPCRAQCRVKVEYEKNGIIIMVHDPVDNMPPFNAPGEMFRKTWMPAVNNDN